MPELGGVVLLLGEETMNVMFNPKGKAAAMLAMATLLLLAVPLVFLSCRARGTDADKAKQAASAAPDASPATGEAKPDTPTKSGVEAVVEGNNAFALELYQRLKAENAGKNLFFSPFSISTGLAMAYAGARGTTEKQMAQVLHFTLDQKDLHPAFQSMLAQVNPKEGPRECEVHIANALWGQTGYHWLPDFLDLTRARYDAVLNEVDFVRDPGGARRTINAWAEDRTQGKIRDVLNAGDIDALTRLLLTNAIYFKGDWLEQFEYSRTRVEPFYLTDGKLVLAPLMNQTEHHPYAKAGGVQILELAYKGEELSMVLFLPKKVDGLASLEKSLTSENLQKWTRALEDQEVNVVLPRFAAECGFNMKETLASMGMVDAFMRGKADFSGMNGAVTGEERLFISQVIHKAFIGVNEVGTEAAAVTAATMELLGLPDDIKGPPLFRADHPFLFLIRYNKTGSILFLGRLMNPEA